MIELDIIHLITMLSVPSAITGFCFWMLQRNISKRDAKQEARDAARKRNKLLVIRGVGAAIALGEATAKSIQRLDPNCNGEMQRALEFAKEVKHEQRDFLNEQGIGNLYE